MKTDDAFKLKVTSSTNRADNITIDRLVTSIYYYTGEANGYEWTAIIDDFGDNCIQVDNNIDWEEDTPFGGKEKSKIESRLKKLLLTHHKEK